MTAETSNARGEVVAWFPTYASGEIVRNYGDGSPVYACRTKEEAEKAKRCHLGATGPVIPLYAAPPPAAAGVQAGEVSAEDVAVLHRIKAALPDVGVNGWYEGVQALERVLARLSQQPGARGVVDEAAVKRAVAAAMSAPVGISLESYVRIVLEAALTAQPPAERLACVDRQLHRRAQR